MEQINNLKYVDSDLQLSDVQLDQLKDAHCHVIETPSTLHLIGDCKTKQLFVMGTTCTDWKQVEEVHTLFSERIVQFYGIHPWFVEKQPECWKSRLEELLLKYPKAMIGEIGIDGIAKNPISKILYDANTQWTFFNTQMNLAAKYQRNVSVHSVQCHGKMMDFFRLLDTDFKMDSRGCPPAIMMHSFSSSAEMCQSLIKLKSIGSRFYFSYSHFVNGRSPKSLNVIKETPDDRILLESDVHDKNLVDESMRKVASMVCKAKNWSPQRLVAQVRSNMDRFLNLKH